MRRRITFNEDGFFFDEERSMHVRWDAVQSISAYKLDLITTDEIRLNFDVGACKQVEVSEDQPGFDEFRHHIENKFSFPDGWWESVMKPAFNTNQIALFRCAVQD